MHGSTRFCASVLDRAAAQALAPRGPSKRAAPSKKARHAASAASACSVTAALLLALLFLDRSDAVALRGLPLDAPAGRQLRAVGDTSFSYTWCVRVSAIRAISCGVLATGTR